MLRVDPVLPCYRPSNRRRRQHGPKTRANADAFNEILFRACSKHGADPDEMKAWLQKAERV